MQMTKISRDSSYCYIAHVRYAYVCICSCVCTYVVVLCTYVQYMSAGFCPGIPGWWLKTDMLCVVLEYIKL